MGYASAQRNLGDCYLKGEGVPQDDKEALKWYLKACEKDNAKAQLAAAECYANRRGIPEGMDENEAYAEAIKWYSKAAGQGIEVAKNKLEKLHIPDNNHQE